MRVLNSSEPPDPVKMLPPARCYADAASCEKCFPAVESATWFLSLPSIAVEVRVFGREHDLTSVKTAFLHASLCGEVLAKKCFAHSVILVSQGKEADPKFFATCWAEDTATLFRRFFTHALRIYFEHILFSALSVKRSPKRLNAKFQSSVIMRFSLSSTWVNSIQGRRNSAAWGQRNRYALLVT